MHLYNFPGYCSMLTDKKRVQAYENALRNAVTKDSVVLDIGAGTGFFSILACKLGARKVYAVEKNSLIHLAKEFAVLNGCADRIEFIQKLSTDIELEEKADILVSDLHGSLPFFDASIATVIDARKRLIKDNAVIIPQTEKVFFSVAECGEFYERNIANFLQELSGVNLSSGKRLLTNRLLKVSEQKVEFLSAPQVFSEVDYRTVEQTDFRADLAFEIEKSGTAHGIRGWFECRLDAENATNNSAENPEATYGAPFLPFDEAVAVEVGDRIEVALENKYENGEYLWNWRTKVSGVSGAAKAEFSQSTMIGTYIPPAQMLKQSEYFTPQPNADAQVDAFIIKRWNGENMQGDIADELLEKFGEKFKSFDDALERVSQVAMRYGE